MLGLQVGFHHSFASFADLPYFYHFHKFVRLWPALTILTDLPNMLLLCRRGPELPFFHRLRYLPTLPSFISAGTMDSFLVTLFLFLADLPF